LNEISFPDPGHEQSLRSQKAQSVPINSKQNYLRYPNQPHRCAYTGIVPWHTGFSGLPENGKSLPGRMYYCSG